MPGLEPVHEVDGNEVRLLHDGAECFPSMLEAIAAAEREILLEMYWFASDRVGRRFAEALADRARAGLCVRIIYDAVGSLEAERSMFEALREAGCGVREFHPIAPWRARFRIGLLNRRDHRKMLIVDGCVGFCGGVNLGDPWAPVEEGGGGFRDDMVRVRGPIAVPMRELFFETWAKLGEQESPPSRLAIRPERADGVGVTLLANHSTLQRIAIRREYLRWIRRAQRSVFLTNSYFLPDWSIRRALIAAARRGVDVRVLLPGQSDLPAVRFASRRLYSRLIRRGVRIFEWSGSVLHSKTAVVDGVWCTVGTYNLDYRSFLLTSRSRSASRMLRSAAPCRLAFFRISSALRRWICGSFASAPSSSASWNISSFSFVSSCSVGAAWRGSLGARCNQWRRRT
ncbi:MAG: phospholipase D-like domain-containing protein [Myxococcales bacterium]|nr:phospholipase D-like domain-containing protein [Myxococcales bacterium]